jgi:hypothetical protein
MEIGIRCDERDSVAAHFAEGSRMQLARHKQQNGRVISEQGGKRTITEGAGKSLCTVPGNAVKGA